MSDTPRTDAAVIEEGFYVPADFARNLERELAEAVELLGDYNQHDDVYTGINQYYALIRAFLAKYREHKP